MNNVLSLGAVVTAALGIVMVATLALRRVRLGLTERRQNLAEDRLRPVALALVAGVSEELPSLNGKDAALIAVVVSRLGRSLRGDARRRLSEFFERFGFVDDQMTILARKRAPWRRARAAYVLGQMGSATAIDALVRALHDPSRDVRSAAALSLGRMEVGDAVTPIVDALEQGRIPRAVATQAFLMIGPPCVPVLRAYVDHPLPPLQLACLAMIGRLGEPSDGVALLARLRDPSADVRAETARTMGRLGARRAAEELRRLLDDSVAFVRTAAAEALGRLGDRESLPALLGQAQSDSQWWPAHAAAAAIRRIEPAVVLRAGAAVNAGEHLREMADLVQL